MDDNQIPDSPDAPISDKLMQALADGIFVCYRVTNHRLDYSIMNRPEPTLTGLDDHALATAIVYAGRYFQIVHEPDAGRDERVSRTDGRTVTYNECVDINFHKRVITSTRRKDMTLDALGGVVVDLMRGAKPSALVQPPKNEPAN